MSGFSGSGGGGSLTPSFDFKASVRAATVIALPAYTQVGNVLTEVGVGALPLIDTVALVNTNRLLVKNEGGGTSIANGIYDVTSVGSGATPWILTRSADADTDAEVTAGMIVPVEEGAVNADTLWILATNNPITLNATPLTFVPFITPVANASTVVKGVVEIGIQAETYAGAPYAGGTGAALVPSITNLLVRRTAATALYSISAGPAPAARGLTAIDFQSIRTAAAQVASGGQSSAFGVYNTASGPGSTAIGRSNTASVVYASAVGFSNSASGVNSSAFGYLNTAGGLRSSAFGNSNSALYLYTSAVGSRNSANGNTHASAFGYNNTANGSHSASFGANNNASSLNSSSFGYGNNSVAANASSFGLLNSASGVSSSSFGNGNSVIANLANGFGTSNYVAGYMSSSFGSTNTVKPTTPNSNAFGRLNIIENGSYISAFGSKNLVGTAVFTAQYGSAFGYNNKIAQGANSDNSTAMGVSNAVIATSASAVGFGNYVNGVFGSAFGKSNFAGPAVNSSAFGHNNVASAYRACAFGGFNTASGYRGCAFGHFNTASADSTTAFGVGNKAVYLAASAVGGGNAAYGVSCNAFGGGNIVHTGFTRSSAFGSGNDVRATDASAFGRLNFVGSAAYTATKSSAFGYGNQVAQFGVSGESNAFGLFNRIDNSGDGSAFGTRNLLGTAANAAVKGSAFGYRNRVAQLFDSGKSSAFGYYNYVDHAEYGSSFGAKNLVGSAANSANQSSAFGYNNKIAQSVIANNATAMGVKNYVNATYGSAVGRLNDVSGTSGSAFGHGNVTGLIAGASAFGYGNKAYGSNTAFGSGNSVSAISNYSIAFGRNNLVGTAILAALGCAVVGVQNIVGQVSTLSLASAFGVSNTVETGTLASAFGAYNISYGNHSNAFGRGNHANGNYSSAFGGSNTANAFSKALAFGYGNVANNTETSCFGRNNSADAARAASFGNSNSVQAAGYRGGAFGYGNAVSSSSAFAFGGQNTTYDSYKSSAFGCHNLIGVAASGLNGINSSAFGYNNRIAQAANSNKASAFGYSNQINGMYGNAIGYKNVIGAVNSCNAFGEGNTVSAAYADAFGSGNDIRATDASAFGRSNLVGTAVYSAVKSSAFGYNNKIAQDANSNGSAAFGYQNTITNGTLQFAFGGSNFIGTAAFSGTKVSAVGYGNRISIYANTLYGNAVGFQNRLDNANYGSSFGSKNRVGYTGFTALKSSAFGHGNLIGQAANSNNASAFGYKNTINANNASAFGYKCTVTGLGANAFGYNAVNRITTTTVINGPIMVRKDNGDGTTPALRFQIFNGAVVVLESQEIDFTAAAADFEIALPAGVTWFFNEIDLKTTNVAALVTQPTIQAGIAGGGANSSKYLAPTLTTLLTAAGKRERYQTLLADDGESSAANLSVGFTVAAAAGTFKGRFILMGILEETQ